MAILITLFVLAALFVVLWVVAEETNESCYMHTDTTETTKILSPPRNRILVFFVAYVRNMLAGETMSKYTKNSVNYSDGMKSAHCGICRYYHARMCALVSGKIDPAYWCKLFKRKLVSQQAA